MKDQINDNGSSVTGSMRQDTPTMNQRRFGECYIGTKIIRAEPMHHNDWLISQGKNVEPNAETLGDGYCVLYEDNYKSWSPKDVFERCYRKITHQEATMTW